MKTRARKGGKALAIPVNSEDLAAARAEAARLRIPLQSLIAVVADHSAQNLASCRSGFRSPDGLDRLSLALPDRMDECLDEIGAHFGLTRNNAVRLVLAEAGRRTG